MSLYGICSDTEGELGWGDGNLCLGRPKKYHRPQLRGGMPAQSGNITLFVPERKKRHPKAQTGAEGDAGRNGFGPQ